MHWNHLLNPSTRELLLCSLNLLRRFLLDLPQLHQSYLSELLQTCNLLHRFLDILKRRES